MNTNPMCPVCRAPMLRTEKRALYCGRSMCGVDPKFVEFMRGYGIEFPSPFLVSSVISMVQYLEAKETGVK